MFPLLGSLLRLLLVSPGSIREIALENLALRQQLAVFKRQCPRPRLRSTDRLFWVWLSRTWKDWRRVLVIVRPETVVSWHRKGFRLFWAWISRRRHQRIAQGRLTREVHHGYVWFVLSSYELHYHVQARSFLWDSYTQSPMDIWPSGSPMLSAAHVLLMASRYPKRRTSLAVNSRTTY
jgi:hypothetical protein